MKTISLAAPIVQKSEGPTTLLDFLEGDCLQLGAHRKTLPKAWRFEISDNTESMIYVVVDGNLRASMPTLHGIDVFLTDVQRGEMIGEAAIFADKIVPLVVEASETSDTFVIDRARFSRAIAEHGAFSTAVMRAMCQRLCRVSRRLADTVTLPMHIRLKIELVRLAKSGPDGILMIDRLPTHEELAFRISSQREAVTKELTKLVRRGFIVRSGRSLIVRGD